MIDSNVVDAERAGEADPVPLRSLEAVGDAEIEDDGHWLLRDQPLADLSVAVGSDRRGVNLPAGRVVDRPSDATWSRELRLVNSALGDRERDSPSAPGSYS